MSYSAIVPSTAWIATVEALGTLRRILAGTPGSCRVRGARRRFWASCSILAFCSMAWIGMDQTQPIASWRFEPSASLCRLLWLVRLRWWRGVLRRETGRNEHHDPYVRGN